MTIRRQALAVHVCAMAVVSWVGMLVHFLYRATPALMAGPVELDGILQARFNIRMHLFLRAHYSSASTVETRLPEPNGLVRASRFWGCKYQCTACLTSRSRYPDCSVSCQLEVLGPTGREWGSGRMERELRTTLLPSSLQHCTGLDQVPFNFDTQDAGALERERVRACRQPDRSEVPCGRPWVAQLSRA